MLHRMNRRPLLAGAVLLGMWMASAELEAQTPDYRDVVYATVNGVPLHLDVYLPDEDLWNTARPVVVWIHGGAWQGGDKADSPIPALPLLDEGIAVVSINYRLTRDSRFPNRTFPAQIHDCKGAVRFVRAHADDYGLDSDRLGVWGMSAGGHLAAMLGLTGGKADLEGTVGGNLNFSSTPLVTVDYFGPTELWTQGGFHDQASSPDSRFLGHSLGDIKANWDNPSAPYPELRRRTEAASPVTHVDPSDGPIFIAHGTADDNIPYSQSVTLANALQAAGVEYQFHTVANAGHNLDAMPHDLARTFLMDHLLIAPAARVWSGGGDGADWYDPLNWTVTGDPQGYDDLTVLDGSPTASKFVRVQSGGRITVGAEGAFTVSDLRVDGGTVTVSGGGVLTAEGLRIDSGTVTVNSGGVLTAADLQAGGGTLVVNGGGVITLAGDGSTIALADPGSLTIVSGGGVDLRGGRMLMGYESDPDDAIGRMWNWLVRGRLFTTETHPLKGLGGFDDAAERIIRVAFTWKGDADCDFDVDLDDLAQLAAHYGQSKNAEWHDGDFDGDGDVDLDDLVLLGTLWGQTTADPLSGPAALAPEPAAAGLLLLFLPTLRRRRRSAPGGSGRRRRA